MSTSLPSRNARLTLRHYLASRTCTLLPRTQLPAITDTHIDVLLRNITLEHIINACDEMQQEGITYAHVYAWSEEVQRRCAGQQEQQPQQSTRIVPHGELSTSASTSASATSTSTSTSTSTPILPGRPAMSTSFLPPKRYTPVQPAAPTVPSLQVRMHDCMLRDMISPDVTRGM